MARAADCTSLSVLSVVKLAFLAPGLVKAAVEGTWTEVDM